MYCAQLFRSALGGRVHRGDRAAPTSVEAAPKDMVCINWRMRVDYVDS